MPGYICFIKTGLENHEAAHEESRVGQRTLARIHAVDNPGVWVLGSFSIKLLDELDARF